MKDYDRTETIKKGAQVVAEHAVMHVAMKAAPVIIAAVAPVAIAAAPVIGTIGLVVACNLWWAAYCREKGGSPFEW